MYAYIFTSFAFPSILFRTAFEVVIMAGRVSSGRTTYILGENIFVDFRII